ncbi:hypothetical protein HPB48_017568 [Haemaphysalis longicornis]|uniref:Uncharacterized protein n=1 Tax=Haemaphysalis longicornis TaxID=44386 RepID=A0A9J6GWX6_HAELO|nr:hypothetical protein HPB48_017568 [Haemaphysalis longicornis]
MTTLKLEWREFPQTQRRFACVSRSRYVTPTVTATFPSCGSRKQVVMSQKTTMDPAHAPPAFRAEAGGRREIPAVLPAQQTAFGVGACSVGGDFYARWRT